MSTTVFQSMNTVLYCRKWRETVGFYRDLLGLPISFESDWFVEFKICETGFLSIADERRSRVRSAAGAGVTVTFRVEDADVAHARLGAAGIERSPVHTHPWGARLFRFHDPEGHRLEVWSASA